MNTIIYQWNIDTKTVLIIDQYAPSKKYNVIKIDNVVYEPIPVYDAQNTIAIEGFGNFVGKTISFELL